MLIKLNNNRKCGPSQFLDNISIIKDNEDFLINFNLKQNIVSTGSTSIISEESTNFSPLNRPSSSILEQIEIKYRDVQNLSTDFGIVVLGLDFLYEKYTLSSITPKTLIERKHFVDYHNENLILPLITYFTPYKGCSFEECNIIIRCLDEVETDIQFEQTISSIKGFMDDGNCWGNVENYPIITSPETMNIGVKSTFNITVPKNTTLYLESNIGILNKTKITQTTDIELDLTSIKDTSEDVIIKVNSKYWAGIAEKRIELIN
jgi:hypothetical protein